MDAGTKSDQLLTLSGIRHELPVRNDTVRGECHFTRPLELKKCVSAKLLTSESPSTNLASQTPIESISIQEILVSRFKLIIHSKEEFKLLAVFARFSPIGQLSSGCD
jgi:hypothetical protein